MARTALVTGSSRGIGRAIALELAAKGFSVAITYLNDLEAAESVRSLCFVHGQSAAFQLDVSEPQEVERVVSAVTQEFGSLEVLVNNAGITFDRTLANLEWQDWQRVLSVNLTGAYNCAKAALPHLVKSGSGRIISISSVVGQRGNFGQVAYAASKAGMIGFTKALALEMARKSVTVNAVAPGFVETDMVKAVPQQILSDIVASIPMKRLCLAEEVASVVSFLASEKSSYITGQVFAINGGLYM